MVSTFSCDNLRHFVTSSAQMHFFGLHSSTRPDVARARSIGAVADAQRLCARLKETPTALSRRRVSRRNIVAVALSRDAFPALDIASSRRTEFRRARLPPRRIQRARSISCVRPNGAPVLPRVDSDLLPCFISSSPTSRARSRRRASVSVPRRCATDGIARELVARHAWTTSPREAVSRF